MAQKVMSLDHSVVSYLQLKIAEIKFTSDYNAAILIIYKAYIMSKVLLWIAVVMGAIYIVRVNYFGSKTYEPFMNGCLVSGASEARCSCLTDYVHERFDDLEVGRILRSDRSDAAFSERVDRVIAAGTLACKSVDQ